VEWKVIEFVFGTEYVMIAESQLPRNVTTISSARELQALDVATLNGPIWYTEKNVPTVTKLTPFSESSDAFLEQLRAGSRCFVDSYASRLAFRLHGVRVALHLRRGDVDEHTQTESRWVSNTCALEVLAWTRRVLANHTFVDIHLFSSTETHGGRVPTKSSDFDVFRERAVSVHLDEGFNDPSGTDRTDLALLHWSHFISADIFIGGLGSFSASPSFLNPNCVLMPTELVDGGVHHCYKMDETARKCILDAAARRTASFGENETKAAKLEARDVWQEAGKYSGNKQKKQKQQLSAFVAAAHAGAGGHHTKGGG
jgi:hypothetical protein